MFCSLTKGKPPTKKAKVLQKQPLVAKLAAYAQYQSNQQSPAKSKSGKPTMMKSINGLSVGFCSGFFLLLFLVKETFVHIVCVFHFWQLSLLRASTGVDTFVAIT